MRKSKKTTYSRDHRRIMYCMHNGLDFDKWNALYERPYSKWLAKKWQTFSAFTKPDMRFTDLGQREFDAWLERTVPEPAEPAK